jgi:hypothetical protein
VAPGANRVGRHPRRFAVGDTARSRDHRGDDKRRKSPPRADSLASLTDPSAFRL